VDVLAKEGAFSRFPPFPFFVEFAPISSVALAISFANASSLDKSTNPPD
jgi:hypothetical protein